MREHDGMEPDRLISEKDIDPAPITILSTKNVKATEIRRRSFFGMTNDAEFNRGDQRWRNCVDPF